MLRKIHGFITLIFPSFFFPSFFFTSFTSFFLSLVFSLTIPAALFPSPSWGAENLNQENWSEVVWDGNIQELERLSASRGITSGDVLWANGRGDLPAPGETLLIPGSKSGVLLTWMEVQKRENGPEPIVTVKPHGIPAALRDASPLVTVKLHGVPRRGQTQTASPTASKEPAPTVPATKAPPIPAPKAPPTKAPAVSSAPNMTVTVSGDQLIIKTPSPKGVAPTGVAPTGVAPKGVTPTGVVPKTVAPSTPPKSVTPKVTAPKGAVPSPSGKMMWPVSGKISSRFGRRGKRHFHAGIDIPMPKGTPIAAALDGVVLEVSTTKTRKYRGYGNAVLIDHGNGIATLYAHCQRVGVKVGQRVKQGDIVGSVGNTGRTTTHHIHFEVRKNGKPVDPIPYLTPR
ncbi:MAG: peptidoglycan DD-metalloendopeptidase family protein [Synergistaceae bacterium]|nr:peptidoglycan DD-metalloendopeptidase family protein [Synergistaceae bacterium]